MAKQQAVKPLMEIILSEEFLREIMREKPPFSGPWPKRRSKA